MVRVGVLGGTGLVRAEAAAGRVEVETPWGDVPVDVLREGDLELLLVARHRDGHAVPPHRVPYRANVDALARSRAERVVALNAVGALSPELAPGTLVVPDDFLDLTSRTDRTFFDDAAVHVDLTEAYCPVVRRALLDAARAEGSDVVDGGVYVAVDGPRLETRAESRMLRGLGGTVVGMTGCPEAALARERCLCYAALAVVANAAAGVAPGTLLSAVSVRDAAAGVADFVWRVVRRAAAALPPARGCACTRALDGARM